MFERLRFMWRFFQDYRAARRGGADHETGLRYVSRARIGEAVGAGPAAFSDEAVDVFADPRAALGPVWIGEAPFALTDRHIAALRRMRFAWDGAEVGAPQQDPDRPYGSDAVREDLCALFGTEDDVALATAQTEMTLALRAALLSGTIAPGVYPVEALTPEACRGALILEPDDLSDAELGFDEAGRVVLTDEHVRLLPYLAVEWGDDAEGIAMDGGLPGPAIDPKRPYGDFTFIAREMAMHLGFPAGPDGGPGAEVEERMDRLHVTMLAALQAFVQHAALEPHEVMVAVG